MTIKARLTLAVVVLLAAATAAIAAVAVTSAHNSMVRRIDSHLRNLVEHPPPPELPAAPPGVRFGPGPAGGAVPPVALPPGPGRPPGRPVLRGASTEAFSDHVELIYGPNGRLRFARAAGFARSPQPLPRLPGVFAAAQLGRFDTPRTVHAVRGGGEYRVLAARGPFGGVRVVGESLHDVNAATDRLLRFVLIGGAVVLLLGAAASWLLIRRGLRPVDRMIATAGAIAAGDLTQRIEHGDDRTELGRLAGALDEMLGQLEASQTRLRQFVADASHELRTPVSSVRGYAELYRRGGLAPGPDLDRAMARIEGESARMGRLVDDLLLLARLDQQRPLERGPVDVSRLARDAVADLRAAAPDRPVTIDADGPAVVTGDEERLRQVIANLLANARVHTPPGTAVDVAVGSANGEVTVSVGDHGPGLPPRERAKVFERFYRADSSRSRDTGGSGLGLAIVAAVVSAHGGSVDVDSEPGQGARFVVSLPAAGAAAATPS